MCRRWRRWLAAAAAFLGAAEGAGVAGRLARARGALGGEARGSASSNDLARCSCDCCVGQEVNREANGGATGRGGSRVCVPRNMGTNPNEESGDCGNTCFEPERDAQLFNSTTREVDYNLHCLRLCVNFDGSAGDRQALGAGGVALAAAEALLCVSRDLAPAAGPASDPDAAAEAPAAPPTAAPAAATTPEVTAAILRLARMHMEEARRHAVDAGLNAKRARRAYESAAASATSPGRGDGRGAYARAEAIAPGDTFAPYGVGTEEAASYDLGEESPPGLPAPPVPVIA